MWDNSAFVRVNTGYIVVQPNNKRVVNLVICEKIGDFYGVEF